MYESYINKIEVVGKLRNLKPGTIRTYQKNVSDFLKFMDKNPENLTCEDARDYRYICKTEVTKLLISTIRMVPLFSFISVFLANSGTTTLYHVPLTITRCQESFLPQISRNFWMQLRT